MSVTLTSSYQTLYTTTHGSGTPLLSVICQAAQTGGSGTKRTIKVRGGFKVNGSTSASCFGYNCSWQPYVYANGNNYYGTTTSIKGSEWWYATDSYRYFEQSITVDVGTTSAATIRVYIATASENTWGGTSSAECSTTATNSRPTWPSRATCDILSPSYTQVGDIYYTPENMSSAKISPSALANDDGGQSNLVYRFYYSIGDGWVQLSDVAASGGSVSYTISSDLAQYIRTSNGYVTFAIEAKDSGGLYSTTLMSKTLHFNQMTKASLSLSSGSITSSTTSFTATVSGASNANGNTTFTYTLKCSGVTVNNASALTSGSNTIYISESRSDGKPYIKLSALKSYFASSNYSGTLSFTLDTKNAYNTTMTSDAVTKTVNLQGAPTAGTVSIGTTGSNASTCYKKYGSTTTYYYIPNGSDYVKVYWNAGTGSLGETVKYELYAAYGTTSGVYGSWQLLGSFSSTATRAYNHVISKQSSQCKIKYKVRVISTVNTNLYTDKESSAITLQTYSRPSMTIGTVTRTDTTGSVSIAINAATSISSVKIAGSWKCYPTGSSTAACSGTLATAQGSQTISLTSLTADKTYDLQVTYNDDSGFSSNITTSIKIGGSAPIICGNKYGLGVGGAAANSSYSINSNGDANISGTLTATQLKVGSNAVYHAGNKPSCSTLGAVPTTRKVNNKALSADITLSASDVSAVPTTRKVNSKALSSDITLSASDVSAVPTTRTIDGTALSSDFNTATLIDTSSGGSQKKAIRFSNGFQIVYLDIYITSGTPVNNKLTDTLYYSSDYWSFPSGATFSQKPTCNVTMSKSGAAEDGGTLAWAAVREDTTNTSQIGIWYFGYASTNVQGSYIHISAFGRWK